MKKKLFPARDPLEIERLNYAAVKGNTLFCLHGDSAPHQNVGITARRLTE